MVSENIGNVDKQRCFFVIILWCYLQMLEIKKDSLFPAAMNLGTAEVLCAMEAFVGHGSISPSEPRITAESSWYRAHSWGLLPTVLECLGKL